MILEIQRDAVNFVQPLNLEKEDKLKMERRKSGIGNRWETIEEIMYANLGTNLISDGKPAQCFIDVMSTSSSFPCIYFGKVISTATTIGSCFCIMSFIIYCSL